MYTPSRWFVIGMGAAFGITLADLAFGAGRLEGKASTSVDSDPSPEDMDAAEPEDSPSPTESDEG